MLFNHSRFFKQQVRPIITSEDLIDVLLRHLSVTNRVVYF